MEVLGIVFKVTGMVGPIFKVSQFMYNYINNIKPPEELMRECKGSFGDVNRRLDEIYVGTDQLTDKMEHLDHITTRGFDQLSERVEGLANTTNHGRRNFKDTNPLMSSLLVIFVRGGEAIL
jgi:hypothetical protein